MKSKHMRFLLFVLIVMLVTLLTAGSAAGEQKPADGEATYRGVMEVVQFDISPRLDSLESAPLEIHSFFEILDDLPTGLEGPFGPQDVDRIVQGSVGVGEIPTPSITFNGPTNLASVSPPDPNGEVGPNHVVVMSNLYFAIYDKAGALLYGPAANNTLWAGFGGDCQTNNSGDPVVIYDQLADRWLLSQFTSSGPTYYECIALSTGPDPTGSYYRWAISTGTNFPDYPKISMWPDAYYLSTREFAGASFAGVGAYAINRSQAIAGNPAPQIISFLVPPGGTPYNIGDGLLPADLDGTTPPPAGAPNYFVGSMDDGGPYGAPQDALTLWKYHVDFATPANSTFILANTIPIAPYDTMFPCSGRNCIPQPGTANKLDVLSYRQRPMFRLAYRNFGSHESLVTNQSVEAAPGMAGIRWWEVRSPNSAPVLYQEGTYAPGISDGIHRWMGSIAMDSAGNMAMGYSASNGTNIFPSVWYTGRLAGDPLGTMPQGEASIVNGTGSQTGSQRWGDYTSIVTDPVDDCTFWHVNEWVPTSSSVGWVLRIGAFKFNECGTPDFTISATPPVQDICTPANANFTVNIGQVEGFNSPVTLSATGNPAGTTKTFNVNPVTPPGSSTLTIGNTGAAAFGSYNIGLTGTSGSNVHNTSVTLNVFTAAAPAPNLLVPSNGASGVSLAPTFTWSAQAQASTYQIEIATDAGFTNIVDSATVSSPNYTPAAPLLGGTTYFWRVRSGNVCGNGSYSSVYSFTTTQLFCRAPALPIPDNNPGGVTDQLVIGATGTLEDLNVVIQASHTWVGDLIFTLTHQDTGTSVVFVDRPGVPATTFGCSGNDIDATMDDEAALPVENECGAGVPTIQGTFIPNNPLSAFDGEDLSGTWILTAADLASGDTGTVSNWCVSPALETRMLYLPLVIRSATSAQSQSQLTTAPGR